MNQLKFGYSFSWSGFNEIVAKALKAENNGFDFLWYHDHLLIPSSSTVLESFSVLGGLAVSTKSCKIGQTVVDAYRRHPSVLAHSVLTLNHMSNGRAFLGIGAGQPMNLDPINLEMSQPFMRLKESIQYIKGLLNATKDLHPSQIFHIPNVLASVLISPDNSHLEPPVRRISYSVPSPDPLVSILIPSRDEGRMLKKCLESLFSETKYTNFEVILIDHETRQSKALKVIREFELKENFSVVAFSGVFNFAALINLGAEAAKGEVLVLLNNDTEIFDGNWLIFFKRPIVVVFFILSSIALIFPLIKKKI